MNSLKILIALVVLLMANLANAQDKFTILITADPQYPWHDDIYPDRLKDGSMISIGLNENSKRQITQQFGDMNTLKKTHFQSIEAILINGDLTAYGHNEQLETFKKMYNDLEIKTYPGLGNHDYENNIGKGQGCGPLNIHNASKTNNDCASRMVRFMHNFLKENKNKSGFSYDFKQKNSVGKTHYTGSLSYSFNIGKLHIVQLQNHPGYTAKWQHFNDKRVKTEYFNITSVLDPIEGTSKSWLEADLDAAKERGDFIIICQHDYLNFESDYPTEKDILASLVNAYNVSAIFAGHNHTKYGEVTTIGDKKVPVILSGGPTQQRYLLANVDIVNKKIYLRKRGDTTVTLLGQDKDGQYKYTDHDPSSTINLLAN